MASYRDVVLALSGLVSYWRLADASGTTAADETVGGLNPLTYTAVTLNQSALLENDATLSTLFAGSATSVALKNPFVGFPTTAISVVMLLHPTDPAQPAIGKTCGLFTYASVAGTNNDFRIFHNVGLSIDITINNVGVAFTGSAFRPSAPRARLLIATWRNSDGRAQLWLDGVLLGTGTVKTGYSFGAGGAVAVGQQQGTVGGTFAAGTAYAGQAQEVALLNRVLTDNEIADLNVAAKRSADVPSIIAVASYALNSVRVTFSKPCIYIDPTANYTIAGLTVTAVTPGADRSYVELTTTGMTQGSTYTLVASAVIGDGVSTLASTSASFIGAIEGSESTAVAIPQDGVIVAGLTSGDTNLAAAIIALSRIDGASTIAGAFKGELYDTHSVGSSTGSTQYYAMRAYRSLTPGYVRWTSTNNPDFAGDAAPFPAAQLSDIIVERQYAA